MNDLEQAAFKAMADFIGDSCKSLLNFGTKVIKDKIDEASVELEIGFKKYLEGNHRRFSKVKTLVNRDKPINIDKVYVDSILHVSGKNVKESKILDLLEAHKLLIVTGIAGSGKSMLLKKAFIRKLKKPERKIPLFIELREVDGSSKTGLLDYLFSQFAEPLTKLTRAQFEYGLSAGKFLLILDGLDEVLPDNRDQVSKQIIDISHKFNDTHILVSSRPDDARFTSWNEFYLCELQPMNKKQVASLLKKIPFDPEAKLRFAQAVEQKLYESHTNFLSNPLLCTMMLLTYDEFLEIPAKMHIFYAHAFEVLFSKHDRTKPVAFKRKFYCDIASDDFRRIFSTFCALSYGKNKIAMTEVLARELVAKALIFEGKIIEPDNFLMDLLESICVLVRDGLFVTFLHRSFQEYFTAIFLSERQIPSIANLIEEAAVRPQDSTISLLYEINRGALEQKYVRPKLQQFCLNDAVLGFDTNLVAFFNLFYLGIIVDSEEESFSILISTGMSGGKVQGRYLPLLNICESLYIKDTDKWSLLREFDWKAWGLKHIDAASEPKAPDRLEFTSISEEMLKETPFHTYLTTLKNKLIDLDLRLSAEEEEQTSLINNILPEVALLGAPSNR